MKINFSEKNYVFLTLLSLAIAALWLFRSGQEYKKIAYEKQVILAFENSCQMKNPAENCLESYLHNLSPEKITLEINFSLDDQPFSGQIISLDPFSKTSSLPSREILEKIGEKEGSVRYQVRVSSENFQAEIHKTLN